MLDPKQLDALLHPQFDPEALKAAKPVASALAASPGAACGKIVFTAEGRRGAGPGWREGRPGPPGDLSRGHRGHAVCPGHPHRARRHDQPRGRCGPRHGHLLRLRLRRHQDGRGQQEVHPGWPRVPRGRLHLPGRHHRATSMARPCPPFHASTEGGYFGRIIGAL